MHMKSISWPGFCAVFAAEKTLLFENVMWSWRYHKETSINRNPLLVRTKRRWKIFLGHTFRTVLKHFLQPCFCWIIYSYRLVSPVYSWADQYIKIDRFSPLAFYTRCNLELQPIHERYTSCYAQKINLLTTCLRSSSALDWRDNKQPWCQT